MLSDRDYTKVNFRRRPPGGDGGILKPLLIVNVVVYALQVMSRGGLTNLISLDFGSLQQGQVWRLGTHMFAHGGFTHILFNMWGLWLFGKPVEERLGGRRLLNLYLVSGLVGAGTWLLFNGSPRPIGRIGNTILVDYPSVVGASGALFGILVAAALLEPNRIYMLLLPPIPLKLRTLAFFYGLIEVFAMFDQRGSSNIAHLAHLGGMLGGYLYMRWVFRGNWQRLGGGRPGRWRAWNPFRAKPRPQAPPPIPFAGGGPERNLMEEVDAILDKIGKYGLDSLTDHERRVLQEVREKLKRRH